MRRVEHVFHSERILELLRRDAARPGCGKAWLSQFADAEHLLRRLDGLVIWHIGHLNPLSDATLHGLLQVPPKGIRPWVSFRISERTCVAETVAVSLRSAPASKSGFLVAAE